jgi:DNA-binding CsgD family transcriptional regulator
MSGWGLINLASIARTRGDLVLAVEQIEDGLRRMREARSTQGMILALGDLGDLARDRGDGALALELYREALDLGRGNPGSRYVTDVIEAVGIVAADAGQLDRAARLLGATAARRDQTGGRYRVAENQAALERAVAAARTALGDGAFAAAWAVGRNLRPALAVAEALAPFTMPAAAPGAVLTPREVQILPLLAAGRTDREIGSALFVSHRTVENHVARLMAKLGVRTRAAAIETARAKGLLPPVQ